MRPIDFFDRGARLFGDEVCARIDGNCLTYSEMSELTHRMAATLQSEGFGRGSAVAVLSPNDPLAFAAVLATLRAGAAWVPINARGTVAEHLHLLRVTGCRLVLAHAAVADHARAVVEQAGGGLELAVFGGAASESSEWRLAPPGSRATEVAEDPDAVVAIPGTGGTTGLPKGVVLTERTFETIVTTFNACLPYPGQERPVNLVAAPMTHGAGMMTFPLLALGAEIVVSAPTPAAILDAIERHRVTQLFLPPTLVYLLVDEQRRRRADVSSLRYLVYGGAPMSVERLKEAMSVLGPVLTQLYGLSEAPIVCSHLSVADHVLAAGDPRFEHRLWSAGRPTIATRVEVMDDDGQLLPARATGEIVLRGSVVMAGYHGNPEATEEAMRFGWYHTGDVGYQDEDGFVYLVDRKRDMIISGGFNIFPSEIEQVIHAHPGVADCAVVGIPDPKWGEAVHAVVEARPGRAVDPDEIQALCRRELGAVKTPKAVEIWPELPRSAVGKVLKRDIREKFWQDQARRVS